MAISIDIINGILAAVDQLEKQGDLDQAKRNHYAELMEQMSVALDGCITGFQRDGVMPAASLAQFLGYSEKMKDSLGDVLSEKIASKIRAVLSNARLFDTDMEISLGKVDVKLLKVLILGNPFQSWFITSVAIKKVQQASESLKQHTARLKRGGE